MSAIRIFFEPTADDVGVEISFDCERLACTHEDAAFAMSFPLTMPIPLLFDLVWNSAVRFGGCFVSPTERLTFEASGDEGLVAIFNEWVRELVARTGADISERLIPTPTSTTAH